MSDYTKEDIQDWIRQEITRDFLGRIKALRDYSAEQVHKHLSRNEVNEAMMFNSGMLQLDDVLDVVRILIGEKKEEMDED